MEQSKLTDGVKVLVRQWWELDPEQVELAMQHVLKELRRGDRVDVLEFQLSRIQTNRLELPYTPIQTRKLAEALVVLQ